MTDILSIVANSEGISITQMQSKSREQEVVSARHKAMYLAKKFTNFSLKTIGKHFGRRDHTTVIHAIQSVEWNMQSDFRYRAKIERLSDRLDAIKAQKPEDNPRREALETISRATITLSRA